MRAALVVAHPDDESLWFGGLLTSQLRAAVRWTIICCSIPRADPVRAYRFFDVCEIFQAEGRVLPFQETDLRIPLPHVECLDLDCYDVIVTHNVVGEYGHPHHVGLNRFIAQRWPGKVVTGGYGKAAGPYRIALTASMLERKMAALRCYADISPTDGKPKWLALIERYGSQFDLGVETYDRPLI